MSEPDRERQFLDSLIPQLNAEGYEVFLHPGPFQLPPAMEGYAPDAIALSASKKLAIEVVSEGRSNGHTLEQIKKRLAATPEWELRVYYLPSDEIAKRIQAIPKVDIEKTLDEVNKLVAEGHLRGALLVSWATLEALGRARLGEMFARPQTPGRLVEVLASRGEITPDEASVLRRLVDRRNRLIHGGLDEEIATNR